MSYLELARQKMQDTQRARERDIALQTVLRMVIELREKAQWLLDVDRMVSMGVALPEKRDEIITEFSHLVRTYLEYDDIRREIDQ